MKSKLTRFLFGGALIALLACQAAAEGKISGITTTAVGDGLQVQIKGEELTAPKIMRVMGGRSFMLEFDASLTSDPQWLKVEQGGVHYVQSVSYQANPPKVRIHVRVEPNTKLDVSANDKGYSVNIVNNAAAPASTPETAPLTVHVFKEPARLNSDTSKRHQHVPVATATSSVHGKMVSLDFVNTEMVQILKALAMQAGVNIVTSPDVKGQLTVSLGNVGVTEALDLITTLGGVKYAQVGRTFVVTGNNQFMSVLQGMNGRTQETSETRVVPLYSGEAPHIKAALKSQASDVEMLLPSEKPVAVAAVATANEGGPEKAAANNLASAAAQANQSSQAQDGKGPKDSYLVLVGSSKRVDEVERMVKDVDEQMCRVLGVEYPRANVMTRTVYHPRGNSAASLLQAIAPNTDKTQGGFHAKIGTVELYATPTGSVSEQSVVLYGRDTEVNRLMENLESIDKLSQSHGDYMIYDVRYLDPRSLREELIVQFPGLAVNIPPASAGNPGLFHGGDIKSEATDRVGSAGGDNSTNSTAGNSSKREGTVSLSADNGQANGLEFPFKDAENLAVPMKLIIRGSREQIDNALAYLNAIDVAPKQVALDLRVMELTKEDALRVGLDWSILTGGTVQSFRLNQGLGDTAATPGTVSTSLGFAGGGIANILGTLDAIGDKNKVLARPNLLAIDGRQSELFVGDVVRYIQSIQATQNGTTVTTGEVPVGVRLAVLPRIGSDGAITMDLRPVVSTLNGFTPVPGGGSLPQTSLRIAQSTMIMHSGDTIAIGGLIQDQDRKHRSGIPILKDLPLLGLLFGRTDNDHKRTEIVFFLSARIVNDSDRANAANPIAHPMENNLGGKRMHKGPKSDKIGR
jgi:type II secretory pathway component GspD/PulD (secretin)